MNHRERVTSMPCFDRPTFWQQTMAMVKRNVILKKRNKGRTISEIMFPLYMVLLCVLMKHVSLPPSFEAIKEPIGNGSNWDKHTKRIPTLWYIFPDDHITKKVINQTIEILKSKYISLETINNISTIYFKLPEDIEREYIKNNKINVDSKSQLGIIFDQSNSAFINGENVTYTIRLAYESIPNSADKNLGLYSSGDDCRSKDANTIYDPFSMYSTYSKCQSALYYTSGFTVLQSAIDSAIIQIISNLQVGNAIPYSRIQLYPMPEYVPDSKLWLSLVPMYLSFGFIPLVSILTVMFVMEKERKIKEGMLMMGLRISSYWMGWFIAQGIIILFLCIIVTIICFTTKVLQHVNPILFFIMILLFGISTIMIAALISPFFQKEKVAASVASVIVMFAGLGHLIIVFLQEYIPNFVYYFIALLSPSAFSLGTSAMTRIGDEMNSDVDFNNMFNDKTFSVGSAILMLLFDNILYALLAMYFDQVIPGEYGPKQSVLFCFKSSFWSPKRTVIQPIERDRSDEGSDVEEISDEYKPKDVIQIKNITKTFGKKKKLTTAVDGISLKIYEDQITGILGHNGAGKSTLINMLVGTLTPTHGNALIYGLDVSNSEDMSNLRSMFGVCLQQDILFDDLNSMEHLEFFALMKGVSKDSVKNEVETLLHNVGLFNHQTTPSKSLSGGQKRKLCIAIALIGNPKIILLDEPTSGVDAYSRRQLWTLLQSYKKGRVLILSTHFMDEADVLADRKAIMTKGKLRCVGSSLFLKKRFGIGYHLTIDVGNNMEPDSVKALIESKIPNAQFDRFAGSEIFYRLPTTETKYFPELFRVLDDNLKMNDDKSIKSYGVSMSTLEEVFLKIGEELEEESKVHDKVQQNHLDHRFESLALNSYKCKPSFMQSFIAFLKLRLLIFTRNKGHVLPIIFYPVIVMLISFAFVKTPDVKNPIPKLIGLNHSLYPNDNNILKYKDNTANIGKFPDFVTTLGTKPIKIDRIDLEILNKSYMTTEVNSFQSSDVSLNMLFNSTFIHSLPILQNILTNLFWMQTKDSNSKLKYINIDNHPFPELDSNSVLKFDGKIYTWVILLSVVLSSMSGMIAMEVVEDRELKIKDMLRVCGLSFREYWFTTLVGHLIMISLALSLTIVSCAFIIKIEFFQHSGAVGSLCICFLLYSPASLLACYVMCYMFNKRDTARSLLPLLCYLPAMVMVIITMIVNGNNQNVGKLLHIIFSFINPFYIPSGVLFQIANTYNIIHYYELTNNKLKQQYPSYFDFGQNITICFIASVFHILLFGLLLPIVDVLKSGGNVLDAFGYKRLNITTNIDPSNEEDADVEKERNDVEHHLSNGYRTKMPIALVQKLRKEYNSGNGLLSKLKKEKPKVKVAVHNLSMMVEPGQIFGLLGPNGAGKTSTMKIIIADERQTSGRVMISGTELMSSISGVFKFMGYCPQHDALWKDVTLREHLHLYAAIRGVPKDLIADECAKIIDDLQITEHADKKAEKLSGGTKRKLCYCIALLGHAKLVLLDEPSTGMDPQSKRFLWKHIQSVFQRNTNNAAILTTHSMEEADALCTRLGIMVKGVMRCIGTIQHLKDKYGAGYTLSIKWNSHDESMDSDKIKNMVSSLFKTYVIKEEFSDRITFGIPQELVQSLSVIFSTLENWRSNITGIEEYSFSQTTIEQVFIGFAKEQESEDM